MASLVSTSKKLGRGLYSVAEAALYARVSPTIMRRWVFGDDRRVPARHERVVSFFDLIQTLAIREIRFQRNLPLSEFRTAVAAARREFGVDYPLAHYHQTVFRDGRLHIRLVDSLIEQERPGTFVELFLRDLTFHQSGVAYEWRTFTSKEGVVVKVCPGRRFGEPLLPSGYTPFAVWDAIRTEGGVEKAAVALGVEKAEVLAAYEYVVDHLNARPTTKRAA